MEYNGGLEKAILRDSELLSEVNDAFCKSHPLLAQKVVTRSARAAVSKIGAEALVSKAHVSIHDTCKSVVFTPNLSQSHVHFKCFVHCTHHQH